MARLLVKYLFGQLQWWECAKYIKFTKLCSKFCQIQNEPFQNGQSCSTLCLSGEISPNLVTLLPRGGGEWDGESRQRTKSVISHPTTILVSLLFAYPESVFWTVKTSDKYCFDAVGWHFVHICHAVAVVVVVVVSVVLVITVGRFLLCKRHTYLCHR